MYKQILESIDGVGIYPIITLVMFFLFFVIVGIWLFTTDKSYFKKLESLPLDEDNQVKILRVKNERK